MKEQPVLTIAMTAGVAGCPMQALLKTLPETAEVYTEPGLTVLRVAPGVLLELHGTGSCMPAHVNDENPVLLSFRVEDVKSTVDHLISKGATVLFSTGAEEGSVCLCHVRLPGGRIVGFFDTNG